MASQPALSIATILQCVFINIPSVNWAFMKMDWILSIAHNFPFLIYLWHQWSITAVRLLSAGYWPFRRSTWGILIIQDCTKSLYLHNQTDYDAFTCETGGKQTRYKASNWMKRRKIKNTVFLLYDVVNWLVPCSHKWGNRLHRRPSLGSRSRFNQTSQKWSLCCPVLQFPLAGAQFSYTFPSHLGHSHF